MPWEECSGHGGISITPRVVGGDGRGCVRVVVVGGKGVGKSALAVRFLTKRYIGEYQDTKGNGTYKTN